MKILKQGSLVHMNSSTHLFLAPLSKHFILSTLGSLNIALIVNMSFSFEILISLFKFEMVDRSSVIST